jgi:hypothetical protein
VKDAGNLDLNLSFSGKKTRLNRRLVVTIHVIEAVERCPTKAMSCEDRRPEENCNHKDTKTRRIQSKTLFFSSLYFCGEKPLLRPGCAGSPE